MEMVLSIKREQFQLLVQIVELFYLDLVPDSIRKLCFDVLQRFICTNRTPKIITSNYNIKRTQHFPKNYNFLPSDTRTFVYLSGDQK